MSFTPIEETKRKCRIGEGCLYAVVSNSGHFIARTNLEDDYGTDFEIKKLVKLNGELINPEAFFRIQLKTTSNWSIDDEQIIYDLDVKAYNTIVYHNQVCTTPQILVLMCLGNQVTNWCDINKDFIRFKNSLFWYYTNSKDYTDNKNSIRIRVPVSQVFDSIAINNLVSQFSISVEGE